MSDYGLVSIITASFNSSNYVANMIESIQSQTYGNWELLITDDCSSDNTCEIIKHYAALDNRIKLLHTDTNSGPGIARNNSIKHAKGRFIAFCDSDDSWKPMKLEKQLTFMVENGHVLTYTSYDTCDESGRRNGYVKCPKRLSYAKIIRNNDIGCLTAIYDADKIGKHFMPTLRKRQDWCLWIQIIKEFGAAYGLRETLATYRVRSGSVSSKKIALLKSNYTVYTSVVGFNPIVSNVVLGGYFMPYYVYKKVKQKIDFKKMNE